MRIFLAIIILCFSLQSLTKADDIKDFQIEGMSIGDSLLDFMSEKEIKKIEKFDFSGKYKGLVLEEKKSSIYDDVQLVYKNNDDKYTIHSLAGRIFFWIILKIVYLKGKKLKKKFLKFSHQHQ